MVRLWKYYFLQTQHFPLVYFFFPLICFFFHFITEPLPIFSSLVPFFFPSSKESFLPSTVIDWCSFPIIKHWLVYSFSSLIGNCFYSDSLLKFSFFDLSPSCLTTIICSLILLKSHHNSILFISYLLRKIININFYYFRFYSFDIQVRIWTFSSCTYNFWNLVDSSSMFKLLGGGYLILNRYSLPHEPVYKYLKPIFWNLKRAKTEFHLITLYKKWLYQKISRG